MGKKTKNAKEMTPSQVIRKRKIDLAVKQGYAELIIRMIVLLLAGYLIFTQVFLITQAHGMGMFPAVKDGDLIIAYRLQTDYQKNDVVVYKHNDQRCIGRIAAAEYDRIEMDDTGELKVNNSVQTGEIAFPTMAKDSVEYPLKVPEGYAFLLGDYRTIAIDSRDFGPVSESEIEGKVITVLRRRGI